MSMSMNKIFYKVKNHLLKQGEKSLGHDRGCQYRNKDGLSCAVGCLIKDVDYIIGLEGKNMNCSPVQDVLTHVIGVNPIKRGDKIDLLQTLQLVHDNSDVCDWQSELEHVKIQYKIGGKV